LHIYAGDQTELVVQVECVEAESTGDALHKVNGTESHFPEVATVKRGNVVKCDHTFEGPNKAK